MTDNKNESKRMLLRYAGLATQFLLIIAAGVFVGLKLDKWLHFSTPVLVWVLPLLMIVGSIIQIIRDTSKKK
jgi:F0F1-type ATP synthase assembly protein I